MTPIDPSLLVHVTGGDPEPNPWITQLSWTLLTLPTVSVVPGPMLGQSRI